MISIDNLFAIIESKKVPLKNQLDEMINKKYNLQIKQRMSIMILDLDLCHVSMLVATIKNKDVVHQY